MATHLLFMALSQPLLELDRDDVLVELGVVLHLLFVHSLVVFFGFHHGKKAKVT